jgi:predicted ribosomally synthesized peptide with nif11-like leader
MAHQTVLAFMNKLNADADLRSRVKSINNVDTLLKIAAESGFVFTAEEWQQTIASTQSGELSEGDLDQVAGGAAYMKFDGVDGEVKSRGHQGTIEINS